MALGPVPFFVGATPDGAPQHSADKVRQVLTASSGPGVGSYSALQPRAASTPTSRVVLGAGGVIVEGRAAIYQGRYADFNDADVNVEVPANTSSATARHMVVIRVEDPNFEGNRNVMQDPIIFPQVISGVPAGAVSLADAGRAGWSAEPIARIDLPGNTGAITNAMITDLRRLSNPRSHTAMWSSHPGSVYGISGPSGWREFWTIARGTLVPEWASRWNLIGMMNGLVIRNGSWQGDIRVTLRDTLNSTLVTSSDYVSISSTSASGDQRFSEPLMDLLTVPPALRGRRVNVIFEANQWAGTGRMEINAQTTIAANITYLESL